MSSAQQRAELQDQIWKIANEVRGSIDGWDFKQYVLGTLFYRFISENFSSYIEGGDPDVNYAELSDDTITDDIKTDTIKTKGYFIYPSQLFCNIAKNANTNESLNTDLATIFTAIESSANGYPSEHCIKGLFADFDTTSNRLGNTVKDKNIRLAAVIKGVEGLSMGNSEDHNIDLFGVAYEYLISKYAANAGKSGGEFFTPQSVSMLIAKLAMHGQDKINKIYDPAAGSGSLLLQAKKQFGDHIIEVGLFGQEINRTTYNLARMNMFLHNVNYDKFNIGLGDTLKDPQFRDDEPFDAIVSNPPYSIGWYDKDDEDLIKDDRFAPAGVLAPKSKADFAFVLHALSYLSAKGRAAIVCFPGIFTRGGKEQKIRKYLIDNNFVETIISLAPNLFFGTPIAVNILVLSKHKSNTKIQFIDASGESFFEKRDNYNILTEDHIEEIQKIFVNKKDIDNFCKLVDLDEIQNENYALSVGSYVEAQDMRTPIDIISLNTEISQTVFKINSFREEIDNIISDIEDNVNSSTLTTLIEQYCPNGLVNESLNAIIDYERPTKYIVKDTNYDDSFKTPVLTAGQSFILGYTNETNSIYEANANNPVIIFDDYTTSFHWVDFEFKIKSSAMKMLRIKSEKKEAVSFRYVYHCMKDIDYEPTDHARQWISKYSIKTIPLPPLPVQEEIVKILDNFTKLTAELTAELTARKKQYEYYRNIILSSNNLDDEV